jgi:glycerol transport system permease protein
MSLVYNLLILATCWGFYTVMTNVDADRERVPG